MSIPLYTVLYDKKAVRLLKKPVCLFALRATPPRKFNNFNNLRIFYRSLTRPAESVLQAGQSLRFPACRHELSPQAALRYPFEDSS